MNTPEVLRKYGVFIGRFQPFHKGHSWSIQKILDADYTPIIVVGSAQAQGTEKNPYSYAQRERMIKEVHKDIIVVPLEDSLESDESWVKRLDELVQNITKGDDYVYFVHNKESEKGKYQSTSKDEFISDKIKHEKVDISYVNDVKISATNIRENLEENKEYLDEKIYDIIKGVSK